MGTRALTFVYDGNKPIVNLYRQYDGYPTGHGAELAEFLNGFTIVNGIGAETTRVANGMGCLAAQVVAHFKDSVGGFYIHSVESTECGQDYEYHVYKGEVTHFDEEGIEQKTTGLRVRVTDRGCNMFGLTMSDKNDSIFDGSVAEFVTFCTEDQLA
jgi:hypothetical protein